MRFFKPSRSKENPLSHLPRPRPRAGWRAATRAHITQQRQLPSWLFFTRQFAAAFSVAVLALAVLAPALFTPRIALAAVAELTVESGTVQVRTTESALFEEVSSHHLLYVGDAVRAERDAVATISFADSSRIQLQSATEVAIRNDNSLAITAGHLDVSAGGAVEIQTPRGSVTAETATLTVAVDAVGDTAVHAVVDSVSVISNSKETLSIPAGSTATLTGAHSSVAPAMPSTYSMRDLFDITVFARSDAFTMLHFAQENNPTALARSREAVIDMLAALSSRLSVDEHTPDIIAAISAKLTHDFAGHPLLAKAQDNMAAVGAINRIASQYQADSRLLSLQPGLHFAEHDNYQPPRELRQLTLALKARMLSASSIHPTVDQLIAISARQLAADIHSRADLKKALSAMESQPLFLPALPHLADAIRPSLHYLIRTETATQQQRVQSYLGV